MLKINENQGVEVQVEMLRVHRGEPKTFQEDMCDPSYQKV